MSQEGATLYHRDNRRHHYVPVGYLESWKKTNAKGAIILLEHLIGPDAGRRREAPVESFFFERGMYDFSTFPSEIGCFPSDMLETGVFASGNEAAFVEVRRQTFERGVEPNEEQWFFLADFCLTLYYRSPRFRVLAELANASFFAGDEHFEALQHHGARTTALTVAGGCAFRRT